MNKKSILIFSGAFILFVLISADVMYGQCAMCKAVLESEAKTGGSNIAKGLNTGILYLMSVPYLMGGAAFVYFYKQHKKNKALQEMA